MTDYQPELGQLVYGQPFLQYEMPQHVEDMLRVLGDTIAELEFTGVDNSPCNNSGERFTCDLFEMHAYSWSDDGQEYNFLYKGNNQPLEIERGDQFKASWYKYLGRGSTVNCDINTVEMYYIFSDCMEYLLTRNYKHL
jgi:hypothetical protein